MALGNQLVNIILGDNIVKPDNKRIKGMHTTSRNYKIACRFYYHFSIKGLRYERTLEQLCIEFDLSELRIAQLIMLERDTLANLKEKDANIKTLAREIPHFSWN